MNTCIPVLFDFLSLFALNQIFYPLTLTRLGGLPSNMKL
jgi:hypothetical protein